MKYFIIGIVLISLLTGGYIIFNGTPWGKYLMNKETIEYLGKKYNQEVVVNKVYYNFDDSFYFDLKYFAVAYPKENPNIKFRISKFDTINDNYFISLWEYEVNSELDPFIKNIFSSRDYGLIKINDNPLYEQYKEHITKIPSYHEVKDLISSKSDIYIKVNENFNDTDEEYQKMFKAIQFIKQKEYKVYKTTFCFYENTKKSDDLLTFGMSYIELQNINNKEDIKKYKGR